MPLNTDKTKHTLTANSSNETETESSSRHRKLVRSNTYPSSSEEYYKRKYLEEEIYSHPNVMNEIRRLFCHCIKESYDPTEFQQKKLSHSSRQKKTWIIIDSIPKTMRDDNKKISKITEITRSISGHNKGSEDKFDSPCSSIMPRFASLGVSSSYKYIHHGKESYLREQTALYKGLTGIYKIEGRSIITLHYKPEEGYSVIGLDKEEIKGKISAYINSSEELKSNLFKLIAKGKPLDDGYTEITSSKNIMLDLFLGLWASNTSSPKLSERTICKNFFSPSFTIKASKEQLENFVKFYSLKTELGELDGSFEKLTTNFDETHLKEEVDASKGHTGRSFSNKEIAKIRFRDSQESFRC